MPTGTSLKQKLVKVIDSATDTESKLYFLRLRFAISPEFFLLFYRFHHTPDFFGVGGDPKV